MLARVGIGVGPPGGVDASAEGVEDQAVLVADDQRQRAIAIGAELADRGRQRSGVGRVGEIEDIERGQHPVEIAVGRDASLIEIVADRRRVAGQTRPVDQDRTAVVRGRQDKVGLRHLKIASHRPADEVLCPTAVAPEQAGARVCDGTRDAAPHRRPGRNDNQRDGVVARSGRLVRQSKEVVVLCARQPAQLSERQEERAGRVGFGLTGVVEKCAAGEEGLIVGKRVSGAAR